MTTNQGTAGQGVGASADGLVERVARLHRFIETRKRIASPSAADEHTLIADLEAIALEASHHAELVEALGEICREFAQSHPLIARGRALLAKIGGDA